MLRGECTDDHHPHCAGDDPDPENSALPHRCGPIASTAGCSSRAATPVTSESASTSPSAKVSPAGTAIVPTDTGSPTVYGYGNGLPEQPGPQCVFGQLQGRYANRIVPKTGEHWLFLNRWRGRALSPPKSGKFCPVLLFTSSSPSTAGTRRLHRWPQREPQLLGVGPHHRGPVGRGLRFFLLPTAGRNAAGR